MSTSVRANAPWWKRFLTPGWLLITLAVIVFSYFAFTFLAPWQLNKDDQIVERNERIEAAYEIDPVPVEELIDDTGAASPQDEWRRVVLEGRYLPEHEVLLRLRPVDRVPAYHSLTPFELNSGETILVNRGFVPATNDDGVPQVDPAPTNEVSLVAMLRPSEAPSDRPALDQEGFTQVYMINTDQISELTGVNLSDSYVQLTEDQPGELNPIPIPKLDRGSHLSYGLQWLAFGVMAPLGLIYFVVNELKERRRVKEEEAEMEAAASAEAASAGPDPHPENEVAPTRSRSVRDRYGESGPSSLPDYARKRRERF